MKKRLFAVLMAVCLVLSTCVLFASAADYNADDIFVGTTTLKKVTAGSDYDITLKIEAVSKATLPIGVDKAAKLTDSQIDSVFKFSANGKTVYYNKGTDPVKNHIDIVANVVLEDGKYFAKIDIEKTTLKALDNAYKAKIDFSADEVKADNENVEKVDNVYKYKSLVGTIIPATPVELVAKLHSLTTGVRFFGSTYNNLVASEIAQVEATYTRNDKPVKSVTNKIEDLMTGEEVTLTASLKLVDGKNVNADFYAFYCWVDASGTVLSTSETITWTAGTSPSAVYATFVETVDRVRISYSAGENGKIVYNEGREIFKGDGQISVLAGKEATFTFVPDEGYEVATVVINGEKNVSSILNLLSDFSLKALQDLIDATNKEVYSYTFTAEELKENVQKPRSIVVTFQKIAALEAPDGKDLPTVAPEGITLATGVAGEEAEGDAEATTVPAEKNNGSNGSDDGIVNPQTGSASAVAVFAVLSVAAGAAFVTSKKKD